MRATRQRADPPGARAPAHARLCGRCDWPMRLADATIGSDKYTGQPYPLRTDRMVFLIEPEHVQMMAYG
jgi:hypothetical protein